MDFMLFDIGCDVSYVYMTMAGIYTSVRVYRIRLWMSLYIVQYVNLTFICLPSQKKIASSVTDLAKKKKKIPSLVPQSALQSAVVSLVSFKPNLIFCLCECSSNPPSPFLLCCGNDGTYFIENESALFSFTSRVRTVHCHCYVEPSLSSSIVSLLSMGMMMDPSLPFFIVY
mmetsp:Transcript_38418/g.43078  ORF Transcript_38418/g.43078 Transcript_38418/m.43078 type:complete len:171 (+) Transcript_38418:80-592(+)